MVGSNLHYQLLNPNIMRRIFFCALFCFATAVAFCQTLHLFGGQNHDEYLGCLNCNNFDKNSIWNEFGIYGNRFNSTSIWSQFGTYGNEFNMYSPWNAYGTNPPIVVDNDGHFYGYFTINEYRAQRAQFDLALTIYKYYDLIRSDVSKWYNIVFYE